jgi:hypothetical protein
MHWTASIAQLIATILMTILRVSVRRNILIEPEANLLPDGYELDATALEITKCRGWEIITDPPSESINLQNASPDHTSRVYARHVLNTRVRLAELSGWQAKWSETARKATQTVEALMDHIYQTQEINMKGNMGSLGEYTWTIPIQLTMDDDKTTPTEVEITMTRTQVDDTWTSWQVESDKIGPSYLSA